MLTRHCLFRSISHENCCDWPFWCRWRTLYIWAFGILCLGDKILIATLCKSHLLAFKFSKFYHSKCYITLQHSKFQLENRIWKIPNSSGQNFFKFLEQNGHKMIYKTTKISTSLNNYVQSLDCTTLTEAFQSSFFPWIRLDQEGPLSLVYTTLKVGAWFTGKLSSPHPEEVDVIYHLFFLQLQTSLDTKNLGNDCFLFVGSGKWKVYTTNESKLGRWG